MDLPKDFADLCSLLTARSVEYLVVGGYAVGFYGAPRFTGDLDLLIGPDPKNVRRMLEAVAAFGFPTAGVTPEYVLDQRKILQLGRVPRQIHLMTSISGVTWEEAWNSRTSGKYMDVPVHYIGFDALVTNNGQRGGARIRRTWMRWSRIGRSSKTRSPRSRSSLSTHHRA
jgi:hypothetical protein